MSGEQDTRGGQVAARPKAGKAGEVSCARGGDRSWSWGDGRRLASARPASLAQAHSSSWGGKAAFKREPGEGEAASVCMESGPPDCGAAWEGT